MKVRGFDWDTTLFTDGNPLVFLHPSISGRFIALGFVPDGRFVLVVFEHDPQTQWARVVTAYEPTHEGWWNRYEKAKRRTKDH